MQLTRLVRDENAVTPVVGIILVVALTVVLSATIGVFVLTTGESVQASPPSANFEFEYVADANPAAPDDNGFEDPSGPTNVDRIRITHTGGEDVPVSELTIQVGPTTIDDIDAASPGLGVENGWSDSVGSGNTLVIEDDKDYNGDGDEDDDVDSFSAGETVRIVWMSPSGESSNTIATSTVPS